MQLFELQAQIDKMNLEEEDMRRARANQSAMGIASKPKVFELKEQKTQAEDSVK